MRADELSALGKLAGGAAGGMATRIKDLHQGVAGRVWGALGAPATPVRAVHDRIASRAYDSARAAVAGGSRLGAQALGAATLADARSLEETLPGRVLLGAINGAWGDGLHQEQSALACPMAFRSRGRSLELDPEALAVAYPDATGRLAIFLHGLCETEDAWRIRAERHQPYGPRLRQELGYTPLYLRYNSGRHISENGRELAGLMERLIESWPVAVNEIVLVGHSMGGLLARSATHYGGASEWCKLVRHVFTLGTPHRGAPLELAAYAACSALSRLPETRPMANAINTRSAGIKDLGRGYLVDEDWREHDPEAFLTRTGHEIPFLRSANHYFVAVTVSREPDSRLARTVGDLLVLRESAWAHGGRGERLRFPVEQYAHVGRATHFDLLNHPAIYALLHRWLTARPALPAPELATA